MKNKVKLSEVVPECGHKVQYEEIQKIKGLLQVKESVSSIARMLGVSRSSVDYVVKKLRDGKESELKYSVVGPYPSKNNKILKQKI